MIACPNCNHKFESRYSPNEKRKKKHLVILMMQVVIRKSHRLEKKLEAVIDGTKTVPFGQAGASDFTIHKDPARKERCINRHKKNECCDDPTTAGFYSRWLLWNKPTLKQSLSDLNNKYTNINFVLK